MLNSSVLPSPRECVGGQPNEVTFTAYKQSALARLDA